MLSIWGNNMREYLNIARDGFKDGLYLLAKYGSIILLIAFALNYFTRINQAALNGEQALIMISELQKKGWIPQLVNGQVPEKRE